MPNNETWREVVQVGLEGSGGSNYGTPVDATRMLLMDSPSSGFTRTRAAHIIKVSTGTRDNVRGVKNRSVAAGGSFKQSMDASEIIEPLLACIQGNVTPTATAAIADPTTAVTATGSASGGTIPAGSYTYRVTDVDAGGAETLPNTASSAAVLTGAASSVALTLIAAGASGTVARRIYRSDGTTEGLVHVIGDNSTTTWTDTGAVSQAQAVSNGKPPTANQTGAGAYVWIFKPSNSLDSQTWEWRAGALDWQESGVYIDTIKVTWSSAANGDTMVEYTLFGKDVVNNAITADLSTRLPVWIEGWETTVAIDNLGDVPGSTIFGTAISGDLTITNNLDRKYYANNTQATAEVPFGEFGLTGSIVIEGDTAALAEFDEWDAATPRLLQLVFGNSADDDVISGTKLKPKVIFNIPCSYTAFDFSGTDAGTRTMKGTLQGNYDAGNAYSLEIVAVNNRSAAYA